MPIRAVVWGENVHEHTNAAVRGIYPDGMHSTIAAALGRGCRARRRHRHAAGAGARARRRRGWPRPTCWSGGAMPPMARSTTPSSSASSSGSGEGMGLIVLHSGAFLEDLQAADGHALQPEMARGGRARAALGRSIPAIRSPAASARSSNCATARCTASRSPCPSRWRPCSSPGSRAARCSAPG